MSDKFIAMVTAIFTTIGTVVSSCAGKEEVNKKPATDDRPSQHQTVMVTPPPVIQLPQVTPTPQTEAIPVFRDEKGGYCITGKSLQSQKPISGPQFVSGDITDVNMLITMVIDNSKLIKEYSNLINGAAGFERKANLANLQRVIDWTSFIVESDTRIRQLAGTVSSDVEEALQYGKNLGYYQEMYNNIVKNK